MKKTAPAIQHAITAALNSHYSCSDRVKVQFLPITWNVRLKFEPDVEPDVEYLDLTLNLTLNGPDVEI